MTVGVHVPAAVDERDVVGEAGRDAAARDALDEVASLVRRHAQAVQLPVLAVGVDAAQDVDPSALQVRPRVGDLEECRGSAGEDLSDQRSHDREDAVHHHEPRHAVVVQQVGGGSHTARSSPFREPGRSD
jgi:hypothetical protein